MAQPQRGHRQWTGGGVLVCTMTARLFCPDQHLHGSSLSGGLGSIPVGHVPYAKVGTLHDLFASWVLLQV